MSSSDLLASEETEHENDDVSETRDEIQLRRPDHERRYESIGSGVAAVCRLGRGLQRQRDATGGGGGLERRVQRRVATVVQLECDAQTVDDAPCRDDVRALLTAATTDTTAAQARRRRW